MPSIINLYIYIEYINSKPIYTTDYKNRRYISDKYQILNTYDIIQKYAPAITYIAIIYSYSLKRLM